MAQRPDRPACQMGCDHSMSANLSRPAASATKPQRHPLIGPRFLFTIRDMLWATALTSALVAWWSDSCDRAAREKRDVEMLTFQEGYLQGSESWVRMADN